ncbi:hypothetical protein B0H16DRAFT_1687353 [Mycena metata]|uniref:Uncharacterized protein n=1 Tax=Mycena metata TaxID=1033252 RepID=A0AAD7NLY0_9AGAR|nr:hypothetical protein B0H16DRAFT_1687353 [Mycena metata]
MYYKTLTLDRNFGRAYENPRGDFQRSLGLSKVAYFHGRAPQLLISPLPPHLSISTSVAKMLKFGGYSSTAYSTLGAAISSLVDRSASPLSGFDVDDFTFLCMRYIHERWAKCYIPSRFIGGEDSEDESSNAGSGSMEWDLITVDADYEEPQRRVLPHELQIDLVVVNFRVIVPAPNGEDVEETARDIPIADPRRQARGVI